MTARSEVAARLAARLRPWAQRSRMSSTILALLGYLSSMSPSLLPRTWLVQGAIAGLSATFGYAVGRLVEHLVVTLARWAEVEVTMAPKARRLLVWGWPTLVTVVVVITPLFTLRLHQRTAELIGTTAPTVVDLILATIVAALLFALLMALWWGVTGLVGWTSEQLNRALPRWVSQTIATIVVIALLAFTVDRLVVATFIERAASAAQSLNEQGIGADPPQSPLRSGSAESAESWESLGNAGRTFVRSGPTREQIAQVTGEASLDPIRVYAGLTGDRDLTDAAAAVVAELERTGGFDREALLVLTTTGTGWVNEWVPSSFEYLTGGNSAVAAMQYSTLPSPLAFIESAALPPEAGTALISAIEDAVRDRPEGSRPRVFLSGESLGAYGAGAAFTSLEDLLARVDGAVFTGTPGFTPLHEQITASRVISSTEVLPVVDDGRHVRFASTPAELTADQFGRGLGPWDFPRVVFLQHRSDPVVWWHPSLLLRSPDWLDEQRRGSPAEQMSWAPFVTFWQVTADLGWANQAPPGEGHRYLQEVVPAVAAVLGDDPDGDYTAIQTAIASTDRSLDGTTAP
ncbi:MAG TPA: hypothetical protein GXZ60_09695 [Intrasporangiaceae bacterium]|nr:hypothetical protein [Intrasporangiaceae bacterium]